MAKTKNQIKAEKASKADKSRAEWLAPKTVSGELTNPADGRTRVLEMRIGLVETINGEIVTRMSETLYRVKVRSGKVYEGDVWMAYSAVGNIALPRPVFGKRVK